MHMRQGKKSHNTSATPSPRIHKTKHQYSTGQTFVLLRANHDFPTESFSVTNSFPPVVEDVEVEVEFPNKRKPSKNHQSTTLPVARVDELKDETNKLFAPIPASVTEQPKPKKKKKTEAPTTISELVQQTEQERLALRGLDAKPKATVSSSSSSFSFHSTTAKANGYNARKQSNLAEIAAGQETPRRKR